MADPNSNFVNPYERIWKTRDLRALEPKPIELENNLSSFERGLGRFGQQMKGTGYGLAALASQGVQNVIGENPVTQGITDWGLEGYNQAMAKSQPGAYYAPKIAGVEDIKSPSDAWEWGTGMLGEQLPLAASLMLTGGVGGAVARLGANAAVKDIAKAAVGTAVKKGIEQGALKAAEGQLVTNAMRNAASKALLDTTLKGAAVTGFMGTAGLEGGLSFGETVQGGAAPADAVKTAIAVGGINGALELLTPFVIAKRMGMGEYAKNSIKEIIKTSPDLSKRAVAIAKELGTRAAKGSAEGGLTETITEGLQELTSIAGERWAKNDPLFADLTEQDWSRIKNSAAGGLFVGGVLGGAGATLSGPQQAEPLTKPPVQPPVVKTKVQAMEEIKNKIVAEIKTAQANGDTAKVDELQKIKEIYDKALEQSQQTKAPTTETPTQETPVPPKEPIDLVTQQQAEADQLLADALKQAQEKVGPVETVPPIREIYTDQIIKQEEEKLAQLAQRKSEAVTEADRQQIDKEIQDQEAALAELSKAAVVTPGPTALDQAAADFGKSYEELKAKESTQVENAPSLESSPTTKNKWTPSILESVADNQRYGIHTWDGKWSVFSADLDESIGGGSTKEQAVNEAVDFLNKNSIPIPKTPTQETPAQETPQPAQEDFVDILPVFPEDTTQVNEVQSLISKAAADGKGVNQLTNLIDNLALDQPGSGWNMEYTTDGKVKIKSVKDSLGGAQWNLEWDEDTNSVNVPQPVNGQVINIANAVNNPYQLTQLKDTIQSVDPWVFAELKADIDFGKSYEEIKAKWGSDIADITEYGPGGITPYMLVEALAASHLYDPNGKLVSPSQDKFGQLGEYIKDGELGGSLAADLVAQGYSPNTVEEFIKLAPPGWNLTGLIHAADNAPNAGNLVALYEDGNGGLIEATSPTKFALFPANSSPDAPTFFGSHQELLNNLAGITNQDSLPPPPKNALGLQGGINSDANSDSSSSQDSQTQNLPLPAPGFTLELLANGIVSYINTSGQKYYYSVDDKQYEIYSYDEHKFLTLNSYEELVNELPSIIASNDAILNQGAQQSTPPTSPLSTSWSSPELPNGYTINGPDIVTAEDQIISTVGLSTAEIIEVAHIHSYLRYAQIPLSEKINLFKDIPTTSAQLAQFKANHPFLLRKVSIDEASTVDHAKTLLNDIVTRRDKYTFSEILQQTIRFQEKFGDEELVTALAEAPKEQYQPPHLDGWLANMRAEEDLLNENPFETVWADYEINKGGQGTPNATEAARYGVVIINPKTGKVLLRKVSNQFEGITWDFARGGADRFSTPDAKPNLIDTNGLGTHYAPADKRYMEHPLIAAKREAKEEFGYDVKIIGQLAKGFYTSNNNYESKMASLYYIAVPVSEQTNEHLQPSQGTHIKETDDTRWVDIHEARNLVMTEPTLPQNIAMKRDGLHRARLARISRTLEAVFNPAMQHSDLDYRSSPKAMERYFKNGLTTDFSNLLSQTALNKNFEDLSELQKLSVAAALYVSKRFPNADTNTKNKLHKEVYAKRVASLKSWMSERIESTKVIDIIKGDTKIDQIQAYLAKTGGKIVMSLWHGSKNTREAMIDDIINPVYLGWGWGGNDSKNGMFFADTKNLAEKWGNKKQHNILVAFNNLKVIPGTISYDSYNFNKIIQQAKNQGYDGVLFDNVNDSHEGRQIVAWNSENMVAAGGEGVGFSGKNLYQSRGELGERLDINTAKVLLNDTFGPLAQKMLDSGLLEFIESGGPDGVAGQWFGEEQKIRVYLDYVSSPRELIGAVLHEGAHAGMRNILGKSAEVYYKELLANGGPAAKSAMYKTAWEGARRYGIENILTPENTAEIERVRAQLQKFDQDFLIEEDLANFVQQADQAMPLWQKIFNAIKAWWAQSAIGKAFKDRGIGFELNPEMAAGLATAALRTQSLRRGGNYATYTAHASKADWDITQKHPYGRPLLKYVLSSGGEGFINYGWGFYTSESVPTHQYYKDTVGKKTYGLHVPDDIPPRMIEWDRELWQQSSIIRDAITNARDNYLLLRMAVKSKDRKSSYPGDTQLNLQEKGTGGALYNQLRDYFHKLNYNGQFGYQYDPETDKQQTRKNLARRDAARRLAEYGIAGVRLLDAGSRKITVTNLGNGMYRLTKGTQNPHVQEFSEQEFIKHVGPDLAAKVKTYPVGEPKNHAGFGFYNSVFWRQSDLDRFTVVYKNGSQVAPKPKKNASYDPNGIGIPYAEHPGFAEYVINPKTGEAHPQLSKAGKTVDVSVEDLRGNIDTVMGEGWLAKAEQAGLVEVVEGVGPNNESGSWDGGKIRLYTGSMPAGGTPAGVLLHEGKHATFKEVLGKALNEYVNDLRTLADNGNQAARDAIVHATIAAAEILGIKHSLYDGGTLADLDAVRAAIEEKHPGLLAEEELAYFVQYGTESQTGVGFLRRLINQIKAWFAQTKLGQRMKELGLGLELTDGMAVEWAKMGLNRSLAKIRVEEQAKAQALYQAAYMPSSARLGRVLEGLNANDPLYSMSIQELRQRLWTDPTDVNQELVNKPGLLQRLRGNFIDFFAEMEKKSKEVYDTYSLLRSKKAGRIEQARQEYYFPLRELIAKSPWSAKEMGDMLAARHIKVDKVNTRLAERASYGFTKDLLKALPKTKQKELQQARVNIKAGKMPDGSDYVDANGNKVVMAATTKQKLMFDLMNKYAQHEVADTNGRQVLREEWELFKDAAGGFSNGGVGKTKVRTVDDVLQMADRDRAKFDEIANLFDALNRHTLDILEEGGLITAKEHARLLADKSAYAPLRRESYNVNREIELLFQRAGQGGSKQVSTRTGTAALSEPALVLQNALAATEAAAAAAERNLANKELYKVIVADREGWKPWFTIVEKDKYVTHDEDGFLQEKHATASNRADITLINDGKKLVIRPNMHNERAMGFVRAVNNLDAQILSGPMQVLGWVNQIVRWVNVSASPVFLMMNAVRDPFTALYNVQASKAGEYTKEIFNFKTYKDSFKALKKVFMDGNRDPNDPDVQLVEEWELAGGRTSFVETLREMDDTWRSFDAQVARRQGNMKQLMQAKDKWIDGIENLNILFENVMRFSTYKVLREHQVSKKEAARISQDLTTNFTRRGYKTQMLGTWWLFFNATVQGNYQVLRNLMGSKKVQAMVGGTIVLGLLLDLLGRAIDDDWDKIPEWDKERFIILPIKVGGDFVRIPAPWVYNVVWRTGGLLGEALSGVKKPQDAVLDIAAMTTTVFNPLGKPGSIAQAISPTGLDPFVQILENKDFSGNPLGPEGFPGAGSKANSELLWSSTPKGYQSIARWVNEFTGGSAVESGAIDLRPADYQLLARFLTGSLGRFMSDATFGVKEALDKGVEGPRDIPVVKEIFSDPYDPLKSQKYHTNIAGIYGAHKLEQMYLRGPDRDLIKLQEVRKDRGEELRMYSQAQDVERQLKSLRVRLKAAQNREDREREKEIKDRMGKIQERFNERYQQRMG